VVTALFTVAGEVVVIVFLVLFLLLLRNRTRAGIIDVAGPDAERQQLTSRIIIDVETQIQQFLLVLLLTGVIVAAATWAVLLWMDVEHAAVWGILAGVFNSIPYFVPSSSPEACWSRDSCREAIWPKRCYCRAWRCSSLRSRAGC